MKALFKHPSAWLPIALSFIVLAFIFVTVAFSDPVVARQPDEGTAAHLFQIWLVLELFMLAFFGFTWLPRKPREAGIILALQIASVLAACAPVALFHL